MPQNFTWDSITSTADTNYISNYISTPKTKPNSVPCGITDTIRSSLEKAFDEGAESPYDLKNSVVRDILSSIETNLESLNLQVAQNVKCTKENIKKITDYVSKQMPQIILSTLREVRCFFAGGMLIHILVGNHDRGSSDWDLFIHKDDWEHCSMYHKLGGNIVYKEEKYISGTSRIQKVGYIPSLSGKYNIVLGNFNILEDVLNDFDFRFLQVGYLFNGKNFETRFLNQSAWDDLMTRKILFNPNRPSGSPIGIIKDRIKKYIKRGFQDCTRLVDSGIMEQLI